MTVFFIVIRPSLASRRHSRFVKFSPFARMQNFRPTIDLTSHLVLKSTFPVGCGGFADIYIAEMHQLHTGNAVVERVPVRLTTFIFVVN